MKRTFIFLLSIAAFSVPLYAAGFLDKKVVKIGEDVPDFQLQDTEGVTYRLSDYRGKVVMIHFWSATCPFVIRYDDRQRKLIYEGAVDDQGWSEDNPVKTHYVREAIEAYLSGAPVPNSVTKSVGCTVKRAF